MEVKDINIFAIISVGLAILVLGMFIQEQFRGITKHAQQSTGNNSIRSIYPQIQSGEPGSLDSALVVTEQLSDYDLLSNETAWRLPW